MSSSRDEYIEFFEQRFLQLVDENLPDNDPYGLSDRDAFRMIIDMILNGRSHRDVTRGRCSEETLLRKHREYADAGVIAQFVQEYGEMHRYVVHGGQRPSFFPRSYATGRKAGR